MCQCHHSDSDSSTSCDDRPFQSTLPPLDAPGDKLQAFESPSLPAKLGIFLIRGYQTMISPLTPPMCRYSPTCSQYTLIAVGRFGLIRGTFMGAWRILRCNPFSKGGYDPVPERPQRKKKSRTSPSSDNTDSAL